MKIYAPPAPRTVYLVELAKTYHAMHIDRLVITHSSQACTCLYTSAAQHSKFHQYPLAAESSCQESCALCVAVDKLCMCCCFGSEVYLCPLLSLLPRLGGSRICSILDMQHCCPCLLGQYNTGQHRTAALVHQRNCNTHILSLDHARSAVSTAIYMYLA